LANHVVLNAKVNYKKELQLGDEAEINTAITTSEGQIISKHSLLSNGKEICHLQFKWNRMPDKD